MSKAEKYLPFILCTLAPAWGLVSGNLNLSEYEFSAILITYFNGVFFLLSIWFLNHWLLYKDNKLKQRLGHNLSFVVANALFITLLAIINFLVTPIGLNEGLPTWTLIMRFVFIILIFNVIIRAQKTMRERTALKYQNLNLQAENLKFQVETLKQQINPHFLFNSLNTLLDLVEEDQKSATEYIRSFSNLYRTVLQSAKMDFIPLRDELSFLSNYWNLLKMRFHDAIELDIHIDEARKDQLIPPLSLQFLVENAVKHNEASASSPLHIKILVEDDHVVVSNRIATKSYPEESEKVGLKNLQQRLCLLYTSDAADDMQCVDLWRPRLVK